MTGERARLVLAHARLGGQVRVIFVGRLIRLAAVRRRQLLFARGRWLFCRINFCQRFRYFRLIFDSQNESFRTLAEIDRRYVQQKCDEQYLYVHFRIFV